MEFFNKESRPKVKDLPDFVMFRFLPAEDKVIVQYAIEYEHDEWMTLYEFGATDWLTLCINSIDVGTKEKVLGLISKEVMADD